MFRIKRITGITLIIILATTQLTADDLSGEINLITPDVIMSGRYYQPELASKTRVMKNGTLRAAFSNDDKNSILIQGMIDLMKNENHNGSATQYILGNLEQQSTALMKASNDDFLLSEEQVEFWFNVDPDVERKIYSYDENANDTLMEIQFLNGASWVNIWSESRSYTANNQPEQTIGRSWSGSGWLNAQRLDYSYNDANNILEEYTSLWIDGDWTEVFRTIYSYDAEARVLEQLSQSLEGSDWEDSYLVISNYDSLGFLAQQLMQISSGTSLENYWLGLYQYDENGYQVEEINKQWAANDWMISDRTVSSYDDAGNIVLAMVSIWVDDAWEENYRAILTYNEFNNQTGTEGYVWNNNRWTKTVDISFGYDDYQNNISYLMQQNWNGSGFQNFIRETRVFIPLDATNLGSAPIATPAEFNLMPNYPNPFNPSTTIEFSLGTPAMVNLQILDLKGRVMATLVSGPKAAGKHQVLFDATGFASGMYLYRLETNDMMQTRKFTIIK